MLNAIETDRQSGVSLDFGSFFVNFAFCVWPTVDGWDATHSSLSTEIHPPMTIIEFKYIRIQFTWAYRKLINKSNGLNKTISRGWLRQKFTKIKFE